MKIARPTEPRSDGKSPLDWVVKWRTRMQPIRTTAEIHAHIKILPAQQPHLYQKLAQEAIKLRLLGMSYTKIGEILGIDPKT